MCYVKASAAELSQELQVIYLVRYLSCLGYCTLTRVYFKRCHCFHVPAILKFLLVMALVVWVLKCVANMGSWCSSPVWGPHFPLLVTVTSLPLVLGCLCCPPDEFRAWSSYLFLWVILKEHSPICGFCCPTLGSLSLYENTLLRVSTSLKWLFHIFLCNLLNSSLGYSLRRWLQK